MQELPERSAVVVVGGGFAGAATAWALARRGHGDVLILERERVVGTHASGRNAAMVRQAELDPVLRRLALRSVGHIRALPAPYPLIGSSGGLLLLDELGAARWSHATFRAHPR